MGYMESAILDGAKGPLCGLGTYSGRGKHWKADLFATRIWPSLAKLQLHDFLPVSTHLTEHHLRSLDHGAMVIC